MDGREACRLMRRGGFDYWIDVNTTRVLNGVVPDGLFLVTHEDTGAPAATAAAMRLSDAEGELGWVVSDPDHRGRRLGRWVCAAVVKRFLECGNCSISLRTDDFRLPAIRVYLELGFVPIIDGPDMQGRWQTVCGRLGVD